MKPPPQPSSLASSFKNSSRFFLFCLHYAHQNVKVTLLANASRPPAVFESRMTPAMSSSMSRTSLQQQQASKTEAAAEALEASARAETLSQIAAIRGTRHFRGYKISLSLIAVLLAVFYIVVIHFFNFVGLLEENSKIIILIILSALFSLINLIGLFAVIAEHLILILIYDIVTKVTLITLNPVTCLQCILLNSYIKELDKIHKLKHKK